MEEEKRGKKTDSHRKRKIKDKDKKKQKKRSSSDDEPRQFDISSSSDKSEDLNMSQIQKPTKMQESIQLVINKRDRQNNKKCKVERKSSSEKSEDDKSQKAGLDCQQKECSEFHKSDSENERQKGSFIPNSFNENMSSSVSRELEDLRKPNDANIKRENSHDIKSRNSSSSHEEYIKFEGGSESEFSENQIKLSESIRVKRKKDKDSVNVICTLLNKNTVDFINNWLSSNNIENKKWKKEDVGGKKDKEAKYINQVSFKTTNQKAFHLKAIFSSFQIESEYEELLAIDDKMAPLLNVEIPFDKQINCDLPLLVINFVVSQLESKKVKISDQEIENKFNAEISRVETTSGYLFKIIGIRSNVEQLKELIGKRLLRCYQNRKKIVYSEEINNEINKIIEDTIKTGCKICKENDNTLRIYSIVDPKINYEDLQNLNVTYLTAQQVKQSLLYKIKEKCELTTSIKIEINDDLKRQITEDKERFKNAILDKFIEKEHIIKCSIIVINNNLIWNFKCEKRNELKVEQLGQKIIKEIKIK